MFGDYDHMTAAEIDEEIGKLRRQCDNITLADARRLQELRAARQHIKSALGRQRRWSPFRG